ncbi:MAG TPA: fructosamine kinase family protein [Longimicrobiaceae bacterium]|nr:fructosamine kinase family protein [Longimicrobiaceae bacterium]
MSLPEAVRRQLEERFGPIRSARPVGGGCVSPALRLELGGSAAFLKYNEEAIPGLFAAEARGLSELRASADGLRVPEVLALHDAAAEGAAGEPSWLLLEWLEPAPRGAGFGERLGGGLAALHRTRDGEGWGAEEDGFIGPLPQSNTRVGEWPNFWREQRLEPQLRRARDAGRQPGDSREWERLFCGLSELLAQGAEDGPSLLHGDLWGGNVLSVAAAGAGEAEPALIDPSSYRGHREVDLAMSELFGGFPSVFYSAYREAWPLQPGYRESRRAIYQLYYLLVHVNLFGGGYVQQTRQLLREALG